MEFDSKLRLLKEHLSEITYLTSILVQASFFFSLFNENLSSIRVYLYSSIIFLISLSCAIYFYRKRKSILGINADLTININSNRTAYRIFFFIAVIVTIISLSPIAYRLIYLYTSWITPNGIEDEIEHGGFNNIFDFELSADEINSSIISTLELDIKKTSYRCNKILNESEKENKEEFTEMSSCLALSIPNDWSINILYGTQFSATDYSNYERRNEFEKKYFQDLKNACRALKLIDRNKGVSILERCPDVMFDFLQNPEWKKRLIALIPNSVAEWNQLEQIYPQQSASLRKVIIQFVGFLDPIFTIKIKNNSSNYITLNRIKYIAIYKGTVKAMLVGAYSTPLYSLEISDGTHVENLSPSIDIKPGEMIKFNIKLKLKTEGPGDKYNLTLELFSNDKIISKFKPFEVVFFRGKEH